MEETPAAGPSRRDGKSWERGKRKERPQSVVACEGGVGEKRPLPGRRARREESPHAGGKGRRVVEDPGEQRRRVGA
jgi:hypothetical protein